MSSTSIVIVGGGLAAASLVDAYREAGGQEMVSILASETVPPYNRPPLSKGVLRGEADADSALIHSAQFYEDAVVELRLGTTVTAIDPSAHEVVLEDGERVAYGTLVVATGARPRTLDVPGADLIGVRTFRTLQDATDVHDARDAHSVVVVGSSFIGAEVASSLRALGRDVTLVDPAGAVMPKLLCPALSDQLAALFEEKGIQLALGEQLESFRGNGRLLTGAHTSSGRDIEAYLAVVGIGVQPNVELAERAGAEVRDGIVVDDRFRTSLPDVYAIGDVARFPDPASGEERRVEHWTNANAHGAHLGRLLAGQEAPYEEVPSFFTQVFDLKIQMLGAPVEVDTCELIGSVAEGKLFATHLLDGQIVGAIVAGYAQDVAAELSRLVGEGARPADPAELVPDATRLRALA